MGTWALAAGAHFTCRWLAIRSLHLRTVNMRRAVRTLLRSTLSRPAPGPTHSRSCGGGSLAAQVLLARARAASGGGVLSAAECSAREPLLLPMRVTEPSLRLGCSLEQAVAAAASADSSSRERSAAALAAGAPYVLARSGGCTWVAFSTAARPADALRAVWRAVALDYAATEQGDEDGADAFAADVLAAGWDVALLSKELERCPRWQLAAAASG